MIDVIADSILDVIKMLPFLTAAYIVIEYIERKHSDDLAAVLAKTGRWGFIPGAILGLVPQCGFSTLAANLYCGGVVGTGTLLSVFLATSDEALPLLLAMDGGGLVAIRLLGFKLIFALFFGGFFTAAINERIDSDDVDCHTEHEDGSLVKAVLFHVLTVGGFLLLIVTILNLVIYFIGEDTLASLIAGTGVLQVFVSGLVGMIPSCASSVLLTQMYMNGQLSFGAMFAGLASGAGLGVLVLIRGERNRKKLLKTLLILYACGVISGLLLSL